MVCNWQMELGLEGDDLDVRQVLLAMRKHRMGLIQTADQLRFSFLAIREGRKLILGLRPKEVGNWEIWNCTWALNHWRQGVVQGSLISLAVVIC